MEKMTVQEAYEFGFEEGYAMHEMENDQNKFWGEVA